MPSLYAYHTTKGVCTFGSSDTSHSTHSLGHFALVHHLQDVLLETARASGKPGRVISLSSSAHFGPYMPTPIRPEGEIDSKQGYSAWPAYGQSKLCNVLLAR